MDDLVSLINQWNINRVELFALSLPNENGEFCGVMRFCYQDAGQKVATKCVRVCSNATTLDVIDSLIEKFRADIKMLSVPQYGLYEIHENGEERKLDDDERPLLVQLNWHKDDREGRFLLKRIDEKSTGESGTLTRKLSKSGKKDKKKKEKNEESKESSLAGKLYDELPETCFTRSISNPEAVMKRRRKQKLEKKLQLLQQNGPDAGGTLRIFGECLNPDVPYKTLLLSAKDTARYVVQQILEKYREIGNFQEAEPASSYCLVLVIEPPQDRLIQYILDDNDCPLAIKQKHNPARGQLTFHIRKRSAECQPQITPGSPQVPSQIPSQLPPQVPTQQLPPQVPPQFPPQLPPQIPLQLQSQLPLQIPVQLPTQVSSQLPSQSSQSSQSSPQLALQSHSMRKMTQSHSMLPPPYHHTIDLGHRIYDNLHGVASSSMSHFPSPSPSPSPAPVPFTIQLRKNENGLGFSIVAARSLRTGQSGIYVKSVIKGGTADQDGRLQPGDQLLSVNNHSLIDIPQEKAAKLMTQSSIVTLEVAKRAAYYNGLATFLNEIQRATPQLPPQYPPQYQPHYSPQHLPHHPAHHPPQYLPQYQPQYQPHHPPHHPPLHPLEHPLQHQPRYPPHHAPQYAPQHLLHHPPQHPSQHPSQRPTQHPPQYQPHHPPQHPPQHPLEHPLDHQQHQRQHQEQHLPQHQPQYQPQHQEKHLSQHLPQHLPQHQEQHLTQNAPNNPSQHPLEHQEHHQLQHLPHNPPQRQTQHQPQPQPQIHEQHLPHNPPQHQPQHQTQHQPQPQPQNHEQYLSQHQEQHQPHNPPQRQTQHQPQNLEQHLPHNPPQHQPQHLPNNPPQHQTQHLPNNPPQHQTQHQPQPQPQNHEHHQPQHLPQHLPHDPPQHQTAHQPPQLPSIASLLEEISEAIENDPSDDDDENFPPNNFKSYGPNVIGANEIYKDPRERIEAEKMKTQPQKTILAGPEKLTFQEKLQLFT